MIQDVFALTSFCSHNQALRARQILHKIATNLAQFSTSSALRMAKIIAEKLPLDVMYDAIIPQRIDAFQQSIANLQCIKRCISFSRSLLLHVTQADWQGTPRPCKLNRVGKQLRSNLQQKCLILGGTCNDYINFQSPET